MAAETRDAHAEEIVGATGPPWRSGVVVLAAAGLLLGYLVAHRQPAHQPALAASEPPAAPALAAGRASGTPVGFGPPGLRLLVGGPFPRLVDASTGASTGLDVPSVGTRAPAWLMPTGGGVVAFVTPVGPGRSVRPRQAYLVRPGSPAMPLGAADSGIATRDGGVITEIRGTSGDLLSGFGPDGRRRWRRVAAGGEPRADTRYGLLVHVADPAVSGQYGALQLVDPVTGSFRRQVAYRATTVLASRDGAVAWLGAGSCPPDCAVRITDLASGITRWVGRRLERLPVAGAFSPDGRWLALSFEASAPADGFTSYPDGLVGLVDLDTGAVSVVHGYGGGVYPPSWVEWSPDGHLAVMMTTLIGPRERIRVAVARRAGRPDGFTLLPWAFLNTRSLAVTG